MMSERSEGVECLCCLQANGLRKVDNTSVGEYSWRAEARDNNLKKEPMHQLLKFDDDL